MVVECAGFKRLGIELWIVHDQRNVDHFLVGRVGLLPHAMRKASLAVVGEPQDDGVVREVGFFECVQHRYDVLVDHGVKIGVEVDVIHARLFVVERNLFVVGLTRLLLDFGLG